MNLVDAYVTEVLKPPYRLGGFWWVEVEIECCGVTSNTKLMFRSEQTAKKVCKGYKTLC